MASVNLWMNSAKSRSSTHYDPHHNLLCIVSGCKQGLIFFVFLFTDFPAFHGLGVGVKLSSSLMGALVLSSCELALCLWHMLS